ncbi:DUF3019 domain-containing protein [Microbulbifer sp. TB1203]|uniref:DUF3019 domain-containing protein n=1 Tax=unclassified Microbulbifer TaxID=2619833 RepID=UPI0035B48E5F
MSIKMRRHHLFAKRIWSALAWRSSAMALTFVCAPLLAEQNQVQLQVKPQRCVSLHQGQTCYQTLVFYWKTPTDGEYCLYYAHSQTPLTCWQGATQTQYEYEFESSESAEYEIRRNGQVEILGSTKVQVASVYKSPKKSTSRWRLF